MDQLVEIIKVVGTPTREEIEAMNPNYTEFKFPQIKAHPWARVFKSKATPEAIDLMGKLLQYTPDKRVTPMHACAHTLFDDCLLYTSPSPRDATLSRMPSSA